MRRAGPQKSPLSPVSCLPYHYMSAAFILCVRARPGGRHWKALSGAGEGLGGTERHGTAPGDIGWQEGEAPSDGMWGLSLIHILTEELGCTAVWIGTPAEETVGGKVDLVRAGAFDDVDLVLQMHLQHQVHIVKGARAHQVHLAAHRLLGRGADPDGRAAQLLRQDVYKRQPPHSIRGRFALLPPNVSRRRPVPFGATQSLPSAA